MFDGFSTVPLFEADTGFHPLLAELTKLCNKQWIVRNAGVDAGRVDGQLAVWTFELCKAPKEVRDKLVREMYVPQWETMHDSTCVELAENVADTLKVRSCFAFLIVLCGLVKVYVVVGMTARRQHIEEIPGMQTIQQGTAYPVHAHRVDQRSRLPKILVSNL